MRSIGRRFALMASVATMLFLGFPPFRGPAGAEVRQASTAESFNAQVPLLKPGDKLIVAAGTTVPGGVRWLSVKGTAESRISVEAETPGTVTVVGGDRDGLTLDKCAYLDISGIVFRGAQRAGVYVGRSSNITFRFCRYLENGDFGLLSGHAPYLTIEDGEAGLSKRQHGLYLSSASSNFVVRRMKLFRNRRAGFQANNQGCPDPFSGGLVEDCRIWGNGIPVDGAPTPEAASINLLVVDRVTVRRCTISDAYSNGIATGNSTNCVIEQNLISTPPGAGRRCIAASGTGHVARRNLFIMGRPLPAIDGEIAQEGNVTAVVPTAAPTAGALP